MATIIKSGTIGTNGTSGASPTKGTNGTDGIFTQNGKIGADSIDVLAIGGNGGAGGNGTAVPGADGGDGGNGSLTFNGNIFNAPASTTIAVHLAATGGNGGTGGTGTTPGNAGKGGNATVSVNGNIVQPNKILTSIEFDALATGGSGSTWGNATSTINGNIFQSSKAVTTVTLNANAAGSGTNSATLNGNIVQGNINNVAFMADAALGTAAINGNIIQTNATNTGTVTLEASGSHIAITNNKFTLGLQELDFTINAFTPYDVTLTGNTLKGLGTNVFKFFDNDLPGPITDTVSINLASQTMVFDGQATNAITGFGTVVGSGGAIYVLTGDDNANTLTGANQNDTFTGGKGNDFINGGLGIDTAIYSGNIANYSITHDGLGGGTVKDNVGTDGNDTLTGIEKLQFADGTYNFLTGTFTGINHAPVLDATKSPALNSEAMNSPAPVGMVGTLVSSLVDFAIPPGQVDNVTDVDPGALLGIALTGTDTTNGTWYYSTNNGTSWTAVGAVSDASALLLAADPNTRLYFAPTAGFSGPDANAITFRAWDQTTGANGQSGVNVSGANNGGSTAFSAVSDVASLTVTGVILNAPPTATNLNAAETYIEDQPLNLTDIVVTDVDSPNVTATLTLSIAAAGALTTATSGAVTSTYNAITGVWSASGALADVNTLLAGVSLVPAANYNGAFTIGTKVDDGSGNIITGTKNITGTPVNDAPAGTSSTLTILEDASRTFTAADFGFTDPVDAASASGPNSLMNVIITAAPSAGTLTYNSLPIGAYPLTVSVANLGLLQFTPALNANGPGYASLGFKVQDNGGLLNGGVDTSAPSTLTFNVTPVNDAPTGTSSTVTILEDNSRTFTAADFGFGDAADAPAPNSLMNVIITSAPTAGTLTYNSLPIGGYPLTVSVANLGLLQFTPAANANGAGYASFGFKVQDNGGTLNGGVDTSAGNTLTFNVTPVNDAPTGTSSTITILEDNSRTFTAADFGFADAADAPSPNSLMNVIITGAPTAGTLTYNNLPIGGYPLTVAAANLGLLKFTPAANANGNGYASFGFQVQDNGGTLNGGIDISTLKTITLNVTPVNDPPVAVNDSYVVGQGQTLTVPVGTGLLSNDTDVDGDTLSTSFITTPSHGSLGISSNGAFTYTPNAGFTGIDTFTYKATDGQVDSNIATVTIKVDGAPVAVNDSYATGLNTPLVVNAAMGLQANDSDPESDPLTSSVVVGPLHGTLSAFNANGSFTYTPNAGYAGPDSFTYKDSDGTLDSNTATVNIAVATGGTFTGPGALVGTPLDDIFLPTAATTSIDGLGNTAIGDTVVFSNATSGVTATLEPGVQDFTGSGLGMTSLANIENLTGSSFDDVLTGDTNRNTLKGGDGNDTLIATTGGDTLDGGTGNNTADFSLATGAVIVDLNTPGSQDVGGGIGPITLVNIQNLTGGAGNDILIGDAGDNILNGGDGADLLVASGGNDVLDGGDGAGDFADFSAATADGLKVDLNTGLGTGGGLGTSMLSNIQNLQGSDHNDTLIGDDNGNVLLGGMGNDILYGHAGANLLQGDAGTDVAYYAGREADGNYTVTGTTQVVNFATSTFDNLTTVERLKFLSPTHVSDVDNDGFGDQVYQKADGSIQITTQSGTNTLAVAPGAGNKAVGTGQFDPDNSRESGLLLQDSSGNLGLITAISGAGSSPVLALSGAAYNTGWTAIGTGDFNGDASSDVLMWNAAGNKAEILLLKENSGDAVGLVNSVSDVTAPGATNWKPIASGDFNGDGKSDIVWQNSSTKQVEVYLMDDATGPTATTLNTPTALAAAGLTAIGTGDFNGDGKSDILFQNASGQAVIWFMNGDSHAGSKTVAKPSAASGWSISGSQDVDNNGYSDIIWTNSGSGAVTATEMGPSSSAVSTSVIGTLSLTPNAGGFHLIASTGGG